jgi:hypothetical protein
MDLRGYGRKHSWLDIRSIVIYVCRDWRMHEKSHP